MREVALLVILAGLAMAVTPGKIEVGQQLTDVEVELQRRHGQRIHLPHDWDCLVGQLVRCCMGQPIPVRYWP